MLDAEKAGTEPKDTPPDELDKIESIHCTTRLEWAVGTDTTSGATVAEIAADDTAIFRNTTLGPAEVDLCLATWDLAELFGQDRPELFGTLPAHEERSPRLDGETAAQLRKALPGNLR